MNIKTKKTLLVLAITWLIVINISALVTMFYKNRIQPPPPQASNNEFFQDARVRGMYRFLKDELHLTDEQFSQFKEINRRNMINSHQIVSNLNNSRREMMIEIAKENPNRKKLDNIATEIGTLHYELKKTTIDHFLALKQICNEDQQQELQQLFMKLLNEQDEMNPPFRERGRRHRKGRIN